jgi:hypothetical protein
MTSADGTTLTQNALIWTVADTLDLELAAAQNARVSVRRGGPAPVTERAFDDADEAVQVPGGEVDHGLSVGAGTSQRPKTMNPLQAGGSPISAH